MIERTSRKGAVEAAASDGDNAKVEQDHSSDLSRLDAAYLDLKSRIMTGQYLPNQRLIEAELTSALGVSRATVRAVLVRLQNDRIVDVEAKRGARVRAVTLEEALRILDIREVLEGLAASLAAKNGTSAQFGELEKILIAMEKSWLLEDFAGHAALNGRFHQAIMTAANHDVLKELLDALHFPLIRYRFRIAFIPGRKKKSIAEHRKIYECLIKRDAAAAERAMRKHIAEVRTDLARAKDVMSL